MLTSGVVIPTVLGVVAVGTGCISNRVGPGVLRNFMQPPRDNDPTADFTREQVENPWAEPAPPPSSRHARRTGERVVSLLTGRTAATIAAVLAGAMPALVWSGTFDENRWFAVPPPRRSPAGKGPPATSTQGHRDDALTSPAADDLIRTWPRL